MLFSEEWLRHYINPALSSDELCETLTMGGLEVEGAEPIAPAFTGVIVAQVLTCDQHPNADKLHVCTVDIGKGEPDGIIAAESSNNADTGGALVPSLALGIPGDPVTAIMLATLTIHGVTPGVRLMTENPEMVYATFAVLMLSNLLMYPSCIITTRMFSFLLRIPEQLLMGFIAVLCILGSYGSRGNLFDVFVTVFMGIAAYFMRRMEFPLPPLVIGLVLGQQFEMSIGQMMLFKGDDSWLAFVSASPIAMVLLGMAFLLLVVPQVQNYRALRAKR